MSTRIENLADDLDKAALETLRADARDRLGRAANAARKSIAGQSFHQTNAFQAGLRLSKGVPAGVDPGDGNHSPPGAEIVNVPLAGFRLDGAVWFLTTGVPYAAGIAKRHKVFDQAADASRRELVK